MVVRIFICIVLIGLAHQAAAASQSGVIAAVKGNVTIVRDDQELAAEASQPVFLNDTVITQAGARLQVLLRDQSTFSVGENAEITIDEFVYTPKDKSGRVAASIDKGAFRFVSGKIAKKNPNNMKVKAGDVVVAVRGTEVIGNVQPDQSSIILLSGAIDVMSLSADCVSGGGGGNAAFEIGPDGDLRMSGSPVVNAPESCAQSINLPGFAVSVSANGEVSEPLRLDLDEVDDVLDRLSINEDAEEETEAEGETATRTESDPEADVDADGNPKESTETAESSAQSESSAAADSSDADLDADGNPKPVVADSEVDREPTASSEPTVDLDANGQPKTDLNLGSTSGALGDDGKPLETDQQADTSFDELLKQDLFGDRGVDSTTSEASTMLDQEVKIDETVTRVGEDGKPLVTEDDGKEETKVSAEEVASEKSEDEVIASSSTPAAPTITIDQVTSQAAISAVTPSAASGTSVGTATIAVSDPNPGDTVTLSPDLNWISLSDIGSGQYSLTISGSGAPATAGSYTTTITASDGSLTATDTIILDVCSFDDCGDYVQSLDGVAPTATLDGSTGFKVSGQTYTFIDNSGALYNSLFGAGKPTGTFEKTWKPTVDSVYGGGDANDSITGRIVVDFANESASIVVMGSLNNLSNVPGGYTKGDLTFGDPSNPHWDYSSGSRAVATTTHSISDISDASTGGVFVIENTFNNQESLEGGVFSYKYRIGVGDDGSGGLGVSGEVFIDDSGTLGSGQQINGGDIQILEPQ